MNRKKLKRSFVLWCFLFVSLFADSVFAHDYWLMPDSFFVGANENVIVRLMLGDKLVVEEERPYKPSSTVSFKLVSKDNVTDLDSIAKDGETPVVSLQIKSEGNHIIALERSTQHIELEAAKFNEYLKEEGLENILFERKRLNEFESTGYENYTRYLKSLIQVNRKNDDTYKTIVGHRLEIVLQENPYKLKPNDLLKVKVLFEGKPLSNTSIFAYNKLKDDIAEQTAKTDSNGLAAFKIQRSGNWIIRLVHMRRCDNCKNANWESFWSSFTFAVK